MGGGGRGPGYQHAAGCCRCCCSEAASCVLQRSSGLAVGAQILDSWTTQHVHARAMPPAGKHNTVHMCLSHHPQEYPKVAGLPAVLGALLRAAVADHTGLLLLMGTILPQREARAARRRFTHGAAAATQARGGNHAPPAGLQRPAPVCRASQAGAPPPLIQGCQCLAPRPSARPQPSSASAGLHLRWRASIPAALPASPLQLSLFGADIVADAICQCLFFIFLSTQTEAFCNTPVSAAVVGKAATCGCHVSMPLRQRTLRGCAARQAATPLILSVPNARERGKGKI